VFLGRRQMSHQNQSLFAVVPQECTGFCFSEATHQMQNFLA
jgi:hypothetical protein